MKTEDAPLEAVLVRSYSRDYFDVFFSVQDVVNHFVENDLLEGKHEPGSRSGSRSNRGLGWREEGCMEEGWREGATEGWMEGGWWDGGMDGGRMEGRRGESSPFHQG